MMQSYWLMPICSPPNFFCAWLAVNFNRNLSECNDCVLRTGDSQAKILFENKDLQVKGRKGETTVLQYRAHPSQQKFFELLGTRELQIVLCSLFHIFTHTPVGIPTVYVQLEFQLCPYCNVTLNPFWVPNWFVNSCRRRVSLQKGRPCIQHKARGLFSQAPLRRFG